MLPPGPFPPSGTEPEGVIDLGIRLRDTLYRRAVLLDARGALHSNIRMAARSPQQLLMVLPSIDAFIDTWPLAAMIEDAMVAWRGAPNPRSLAVMFRASEVIGHVLGWPRSVDRRWPLPDEAWMRRHVENRTVVVVPRGPRDGSAAAAVALNSNFVSAEPMKLPRTLVAHGDELVDRLDELLGAVRTGVAKAVDIDGWIPWDEASQAAAKALDDASATQAAYSRYGLAALVAGAAPPFDGVLTDAPAGEWGDEFRRTCDALVVPTLDGEGAMSPIGVLCWDDAFRPIKVNPVAISVLEAIDDHPTPAEAAVALKAEENLVRNVLKQLVEVGAVTAWVDDADTMNPEDDEVIVRKPASGKPDSERG
ncbi:MAG: hypothetical protein H6737_28395 [Alphaproteobacteria bacterium]|nr:hypothetical protein [Alphaproteobacteria bacterium]